MDLELYASALYVDLGIFNKNMQILTRRHSRVIPVLKSDAYGLGLVPIARALEGVPGVEMLAVAQVLEGVQLRQAGIRMPILVLGATLPRQWPAACRQDLTLTVTNPGMVAALEALEMPVSVQLKIETGLNRNGIRPGEELAAVIGDLKMSCYVNLTGTYSHFADAESREESLCLAQVERFDRALAQLTEAGIDPGLRHMCNSAAAEWFPRAAYDAVRIGRGLYMDSQDHPSGELGEVASWRAALVGKRQLQAGDRLCYGQGLRLQRDTLVGVVNVGYGDGLHRSMARGGQVLVAGGRCTLLGCCMDQCFVDLGAADVPLGSEVTLFGYDSLGNFLPSQEAARLCDDEGCGLTAALGNRVVRIYTE